MRAVIAVVLIVVGILGLAYGGFSFMYPEKVADVGPIHVSKEKHESVPIPPIVGALALAGGIVVLVTNKGH